MALQIRDAGTLRTIKKLTIRQAGVNRSIRTLKIMDGGVLRTVAIFADPLAVTAPDVTGRYSSGGSSTITTNASEAVATGGFGPYTYQWALASNGGGNPSGATAYTSASSAFTKTNVPENQTYIDRWKVTVTDSLGSQAEDEISATFTNEGIS